MFQNSPQQKLSINQIFSATKVYKRKKHHNKKIKAESV